MAISVKNLDDRLKVLENIKPSGMTITALLTRASHNGTKTLTDDISKYDFIVIFFETTGNIYTPACVPSKLCQTDGRRCYFFCNGTDWGVRYNFPTNTSVTIIPYQDGSYSMIYGLKIYYIFRYNILAKILLRNISRFSHFLHQNTNFGGEFRMAISMKNHEDRIVALEQKVVESGYSETVLWSSSGTQNPTSLKLLQSIRNFDLVIFYYNHYNNGGPYTKIEPTSHITTSNLDIWVGSDQATSTGRAAWVKTSDGITLSFTRRDTNTIFYKITGVKFSKVILYYFSNIIKLKFIRSINSRNSHFRQAS